jgi:hypothetical protein
MTCSNCMGVSLLYTTYKIFSNILFKRLAPCIEGVIGDYQHAFHQGRSTSDQIFNLHQVLENVLNLELKHITCS